MLPKIEACTLHKIILETRANTFGSNGKQQGDVYVMRQHVHMENFCLALNLFLFAFKYLIHNAQNHTNAKIL